MAPSQCLKLNQAVSLHLTSIFRGCNCGYICIKTFGYIEGSTSRWIYLFWRTFGPPSRGQMCNIGFHRKWNLTFLVKICIFLPSVVYVNISKSIIIQFSILKVFSFFSEFHYCSIWMTTKNYESKIYHWLMGMGETIAVVLYCSHL